MEGRRKAWLVNTCKAPSLSLSFCAIFLWLFPVHCLSPKWISVNIISLSVSFYSLTTTPAKAPLPPGPTQLVGQKSKSIFAIVGFVVVVVTKWNINFPTKAAAFAFTLNCRHSADISSTSESLCIISPVTVTSPSTMTNNSFDIDYSKTLKQLFASISELYAHLMYR